MAVYKICDRCGARIMPKHSAWDIVKRTVEYTTFRLFSSDYVECDEFDLCPSCGREFVDWMHGGGSKQ